jgi:hypothetical protein
MTRPQPHQGHQDRALQLEVAALARQRGYTVRMANLSAGTGGFVALVDAQGKTVFQGATAASAKAWLVIPR